MIQSDWDGPGAKVFMTSDGYRLVKTSVGLWTDGDMTFDSGLDGLPVESMTDGDGNDVTLDGTAIG